jgi:hypothetical protein
VRVWIRLLNDRLTRVIALARQHGHHLILLFLDLDRFKHVNDSLGHVSWTSSRTRATPTATDREGLKLPSWGGRMDKAWWNTLGGAGTAPRR